MYRYHVILTAVQLITTITAIIHKVTSNITWQARTIYTAEVVCAFADSLYNDLI
jgi:hypothetical protein